MSTVLNRADNVMGSRSPLPTDTYVVRCVKVEGKHNDKWGCPQTNTQWEILSPEEGEVNGKLEKFAGRKFSVCFMHLQTEEWGQARVAAFGDTLGLDQETVDDLDAFREWLKGKPTLEWMLSSKEDVKRYPKGYADPSKAGQVMKTASGQTISNGHQIVAELNLALAIVD